MYDTEILLPEQGIAKGAQLIRAGEVVAFPTETVYGLGGNALNRDSIAKIYKAKGRPQDNPLIVHVSCMEEIPPLVKEFSDRNRLVAQAFMPGPITLLFPRSQSVPIEVSAGLNTVGIRMPENPIAREFIKQCGVPIAAPSANASTRVSPTTAAHVYEDMAGRIPLIIDGGESSVGIESTVLDLTGEVPTILRPGAITTDMLLQVLGSVRTHTGEIISAAPAPGMKYKHYAPKVEMVIATDTDKLLAEYNRAVALGRHPLALIRHADISNFEGKNYYDLGKSDVEVCRNIYKAMRDTEKICDYIICIHLGDEGIAASVMNRVTKAAGGRII